MGGTKRAAAVSPRRATRAAATLPPKSTKRPLRNGAPQTKHPVILLEDREDDSSVEWEEDVEEESISDVGVEVEERPRKRRKPRDDGDLACPHCRKVLSSALGLQYHVEQFVCRPALRPGGPVIRGRRKTTGEGASKYPKIRGKQVADRTCPQCQRVFTSVHGMQYHRDKRVCEQKLSETTSTTPYATIAPGQCYVTPYGIVQVIYDDRATPTAVVENQEQAKSKLKLYYSALSKREARYQKQFLNVAVISQARRLLLQRDYERNQGKVDAQAVRRIYEVCGSVPAPSPRSALDDPSAPPESHPDRIVEGLLIPDQRPRYLGPRRSNETDATPQQDFTLLEGLATTTDPTAALPKIFLPRRLLTTLYTPEAARYYCPCCFQCFASKPGYKYHVQEEGACRSKLQAKASAWAEQRRTVDTRARQFVARYDASTHPLVPKTKHPPPLAGQADTAADPSVIPRKKPKKVSVLPVDEPPAMPEDDLDASSSTLLHEPDSNDLDASNFVSPDVVLAQLETEFYRLQGSMLGPMYPSIWKALGYRKPVTKPKRKRAKRDAAVAVPAASTAPSTDHADLAIIDIYPLVQEVDAGRYPSMKRYRGEHREDQCSICKERDLVDGVDEGKLIPCNFCSQVEHFSCAQTKFILKYPEPGDDFMCHNCIGIIAARRMRAEKRRLEKLQSNEESSPIKSVPLQEQQYSSTDPARLKELHALTSGVVRNREFDCVAAQGSRLQELSVLLRDAKTRLTVRLEGMKMNQMRHSLIETAYSEDEIVGSRMQSSAKCFDA